MDNVRLRRKQHCSRAYDVMAMSQAARDGTNTNTKNTDESIQSIPKRLLVPIP